MFETAKIRIVNPRCCRTCNRPLIGHALRLEETCQSCTAPRSGTRSARGCCKVCRIDDPRMLTSCRLADGWSLLCANHAAVLGGRWLRLSDLTRECA